MRLSPGVLASLLVLATGCGISTSAPQPTATPTQTPLRPTPQPTTTSITTPAALYSQQHVGPGRFQLINNLTLQFVQVSAHGLKTICVGECTNYLTLAATVYSGNVQTSESPRQFALKRADNSRYTPATPRQAARVVQPIQLLQATVLQPDDDGDYATGMVVFVVPKGAGRFNLLWHGMHVATLTTTARGKVYETR